jgi:dTDP-4-amino-4,6-dideoxygalactose transaminase
MTVREPSTIPAVDLAWQHRMLRSEINAAVARVIGGSSFILGQEVEAFEREFAAHCGARHAVGVGNGQDAIKLALLALGIGRGDEVIVPANTCTPTWLGVAASGAAPVAAEPDPATMNLAPAAAEAAITDRTRAIIPVHLYGQPANLPALDRLARAHDLKLVHDCAQAHGAAIGNRPLGAFGDAAAWSFYPTKNLGALGDGGAVTTDDDQTADRLRSLRNGGTADDWPQAPPGVNSRLDELQAAVLSVKLPHLGAWNAQRAKIAEIYLAELAQTDIVLPQPAADTTPAWHMFVIRTPDRDRLKDHLAAQGIDTLVRYRDLPYLAPCFAAPGGDGPSFPVSEQIRHRVLSLPMGPHLEPDQARAVCAAIRGFG